MEFIKEKKKFIKIHIFIFYFFLIFKILIKSIEDNNSLEDYFAQTLCKYFHFERNYNCYNNLFNNTKIYDDLIEINQNIDLIINIKKTTIENIFLLIGIFPFLKNNSTLTFKIKDKKIFNIFKSIHRNKKIRREITINKYDFHIFNEKLNDLINYKWELIPNQNISKTIRYIINNYYNETSLYIFDKSLNFNFEYYIENNKYKLSKKQIKHLMCKITFYIYFCVD